MKYLLSLILSLLIISCNQSTINKPIENRTVELVEIDTTEKHFDCIVTEIYEESPGDRVFITECGLCVHTKNLYQVGDTLKGFVSPKHK